MGCEGCSLQLVLEQEFLLLGAGSVGQGLGCPKSIKPNWEAGVFTTEKMFEV